MHTLQHEMFYDSMLLQRIEIKTVLTTVLSSVKPTKEILLYIKKCFPVKPLKAVQILPGNVAGSCISQQTIKESFPAQATSGTSGSRDLLANRCLKQMKADHEKEV